MSDLPKPENNAFLKKTVLFWIFTVFMFIALFFTTTYLEAIFKLPYWVVPIIIFIDICLGVLSFILFIVTLLFDSKKAGIVATVLSIMVFVGFGIFVAFTYQNIRLEELNKEVTNLENKDQQKPPVNMPPLTPQNYPPVVSAPLPPAQSAVEEKKLVKVDVPRRDEDVMCDFNKAQELVSKIAKYDQNQERLDLDEDAFEYCEKEGFYCHYYSVEDREKFRRENEIFLKEINFLLANYCWEM